MRIDWRNAVDIAQECGFSHAVLVPAEPVPLAHNAESMRLGIVADPVQVFPEARSVLVAAMPFAWYAPWPNDCAQVSAFYFHSQHAHQAINAAAQALAEAGVRVCADQRLPSKIFGARAGLGVIGRNSLLRNAAWGTCFALRTLLTDLAPPPDIAPSSTPPCGACMRCVQACPTAALSRDGILDPARCVRTYMLRSEPVPDGLRKSMGMRLVGCEICQRACPHNAEIALATPEAADTLRIDRLLAGDPENLRAVARRIGRNEARPQRVLAQAALAAGNSGNKQYIPLLTGLTDHKQPAVAAHARWAITTLEREDDQ